MWVHLLSLELIDGAGGTPGATYTLTADGATFTYTGGDAGLQFNRVLAAEVGTYSYSGTDAGLRFGRVLAANGAAYTYAGQDAALTFTPATDRTLAAEGATYTYSGGDATLTYSGASAGDVPGIDFSFGETSTKTPKWWAKSGQQDEPEAAEPQKAKPKREAKKAQEAAKQVIEAVAREQVARGDVPKSARFAEVRSQIKPLGRDATEFNWPALYERLYAQALTDAIRQEMATAEAMQVQRQLMQQEEEALLLLLAEA